MTRKNLQTLTGIMARLAMSGHLDVMGMGRLPVDIDKAPEKPKRVIPNGCKLYTFYGIEVVATSQKRAQEKAYKQYKRLNP